MPHQATRQRKPASADARAWIVIQLLPNVRTDGYGYANGPVNDQTAECRQRDRAIPEYHAHIFYSYSRESLRASQKKLERSGFQQ